MLLAAIVVALATGRAAAAADTGWRSLAIPIPAAAAPAAPHAPPGTVLPWDTPVSWDIRLVARDEPGPRFEMSGRLLRPDSTPAAGVKLYVYHADSKGWYARHTMEFNRVAGVLRTNARGEYRIRSVVPGMYDGPGHVHVEVWDGAHPRRGTTVTLSALPGTPPVPTWRYTNTATREWKPGMGLLSCDSSGAYHCRHDLRLGDMTPMPAAYDSTMQAWRRAVRARHER